MQYLGGKHRIATMLAAYLESRRHGRLFVEPFCGGLSVTAAMTGPRVAVDAHAGLLVLYDAWRGGWRPPERVTEARYDELRRNQDLRDPLTTFAGFGLSFGGKWFGGFARGAAGRNYQENATRSLNKKIARCQDVLFGCADYRRLRPTSEHLVYCDPPYESTTSYSGVDRFNHAEFWATVRSWARAGVTVLVSEYQAPADFTLVWEVLRNLAMQSTQARVRAERLFEYRVR